MHKIYKQLKIYQDCIKKISRKQHAQIYTHSTFMYIFKNNISTILYNHKLNHIIKIYLKQIKMDQDYIKTPRKYHAKNFNILDIFM